MATHTAAVLETHGKHIDNTISDEHFGTGYEFNRYDNTHSTEQYKFNEIMDRLDVKYLRYPGGTQTENYFDPSDPDASQREAYGEPPLVGDPKKFESFTPISEFLQIAAQHNAKVLIVLPTYRFFDADENSKFKDEVDVPEYTDDSGVLRTTKSPERVIKDFVIELLQGKHHGEGENEVDVEIYGFEIGNEWFQDIFDWTASEFGAVQSQIALWVQEAIEESGYAGDPKIYVQSSGSGDRNVDENFDANGDPIYDNIEIFAQFNEDEQAAVDGIVDHFYYPTKADDTDKDGDIDALDHKHTPADRIDRIFSEMNWEDNDDLERAKYEVVTTEWNIRADVVNEITGFERQPLLVGHFAELIRNGLDFATFWTPQALGDSNGSLSEQYEDTLHRPAFCFG